MSKNLLTIILFSVVVFLSIYSVWRISQPRILSSEEMKVNGYFGYGSFEELRDFNLVDHNGDIFTKENLKDQSLNFLYFGYSCLLYTSPSPRDEALSRMPSSA